MRAQATVLTSTPAAATAAGLFLATAAVTAAWLGLNFMFPSINPTGIPTAVVRLAIHAVILIGLWQALARTEFNRNERLTIWLALVVPFTAWLALIWALAADGAFVQPPGQTLPRVPLAIFLPLLLLFPLLRSRRIGALLDATPPSWLVALQVYRVFGGIFLVSWAWGNLSSQFALPAGTGDVLVGLLALPIAYWLYAGARGGRALAIAWNVFGIADLALAVAMGALTAPGPLQLITPDRPNALGVYPTVLIPAFAAPSSILLHALSLRQLQRLSRKQAGATP